MIRNFYVYGSASQLLFRKGYQEKLRKRNNMTKSKEMLYREAH